MNYRLWHESYSYQYAYIGDAILLTIVDLTPPI